MLPGEDGQRFTTTGVPALRLHLAFRRLARIWGSASRATTGPSKPYGTLLPRPPQPGFCLLRQPYGLWPRSVNGGLVLKRVFQNRGLGRTSISDGPGAITGLT